MSIFNQYYIEAMGCTFVLTDDFFVIVRLDGLFVGRFPFIKMGWLRPGGLPN